MSDIVVSDPLALVAIESGLVKAPIADTTAKGANQLETTQRSAVIGEPVPIVFCRRDETGATGGVLISPPATEARFVNNSKNTLTTSYHLVLSEGQIGSIQVRDVFQGACRVGTFSQTYNRRAGTWLPENDVTDVNQGYRRFFTTDIFALDTQAKLDKYNAILTATLLDPAELSNYPYNLISNWDEATLTDPDNPEKDASWDYGTTDGRTLIKDILPTNYKTPECSYYCGSIGTYTGMSTLSFRIVTKDGIDRWNRQVHCFIRNGMMVDRLIEEDVASSNNYADLVNWALINCAQLAPIMIDTAALTEAAQFLAVNGFNCDICIKDSANLADFLANTAPYFLLAETRNNGKRGLRPLLPLNNDYTIKTTAVDWLFTFNEDHIIPGTLEISYVPLVDRQPFCVQTTWKQTLTDDFAIIRTSEVRYSGEAVNGPYEQHDLSSFCTREDHAVKVGAYIRARRKHITHTARFSCRALDFGEVELVPGDIVRVQLMRGSNVDDVVLHNYLYEINRITKDPSGQMTFEVTHFPIDADGASLVAIDVDAADGNGVLLDSDKSGVSCDLNSKTDTTVPAETYTDEPPLDDQVIIDPTEEGEPPFDPPLEAARIASLYFFSVKWEDLDLVVKVRVAPAGRAAVTGLGSLTATLVNGTTLAYDENDRPVSPQPSGLPTFNLSGTVAQEWSEVSAPNKPATVPPYWIFEGEFRQTYSLSDFPTEESGLTYRMPINITSTSGGFDQVTILNSGLAVFKPQLPPLNNNTLLIHFDGADNSTAFVDSGTNEITLAVNAGAKISTGQSKFGGASGYFAGLNYVEATGSAAEGDHIQANSSSLALGTGDFTIEAWVYAIRDTRTLPWTGQPIDYKAICTFPDNSDDTGVYLYQYGAGTGCTLQWYDGVNNDGIESGDYLSYETWHHIAVVRANGVISLYCNGTKQASTYSGNPSITGPRVRIGNDSLGQLGIEGEPFYGCIDELRIKKAAVYTNTFTPPTEPFT